MHMNRFDLEYYWSRIKEPYSIWKYSRTLNISLRSAYDAYTCIQHEFGNGSCPNCGITEKLFHYSLAREALRDGEWRMKHSE